MKKLYIITIYLVGFVLFYALMEFIGVDAIINNVLGDGNQPKIYNKISKYILFILA